MAGHHRCAIIRVHTLSQTTGALCMALALVYMLVLLLDGRPIYGVIRFFASMTSSSGVPQAREGNRKDRSVDAYTRLISAVSYDLAVLEEATARLDWIPVTRLIRNYGKLMPFEQLNMDAVKWYLDDIEQRVFDWKVDGMPPIRHWRDTWKGRGIVIAAGDYQALMAIQLIRGLREVLHCELPVEVVFKGAQDLSPAYYKLLRKSGLTNTRLIDASLIINITGKVALDNYSSKFAAILASSFAEIIFLDADTVPLVDPAKLFDDPLYKTFSLLFPAQDRLAYLVDWANVPKDYSRTTRLWLSSFIPDMSDMTLNARILAAPPGEEVYNYVDACVFALNKRKRFLTTLSLMKLGEPEFRREMYYRFWGDKESFWVGAEMSGEGPYGMWPYGRGVIGREDPAVVNYGSSSPGTPCNVGVCSNQDLVFDPQGRMYLWNGALLADKSRPEFGFANFTVYGRFPPRRIPDIKPRRSGPVEWRCYPLRTKPVVEPERSIINHYLAVAREVMLHVRVLSKSGELSGVVSGRRKSEGYRIESAVQRNMLAVQAMEQRRRKEARFEALNVSDL